MIGACARPGRPMGGPEDRAPPMVVSTWPDTFEVIAATRDPVRINFNERVSERPTQGRLADAVIVSPAMGDVDVKHTRTGLEIAVAGGFKAGLVYRVRVLPILRDLFNNPMEGPFELVFSTGGEFDAHVLAGVVTDRITGEPVEGARVDATRIGEEGAEPGPAYTSRTDSAGIYILRYVPAGPFTVAVYEDVNRNRQADFRELQGTASVQLGLLPPRKDTLVTSLALLRPDTTPARLIRVEAPDSLVLEVEFDDFLPPGLPPGASQISVRAEGQEEIGVVAVLWERELDSLRAFRDSVRVADSLRMRTDSLQALADSLGALLPALRAAGDSVAIDSVARALDAVLARLAPSVAPAPPPRQAARGQARGPDEPRPILPEQGFFLILASPLPRDVPHMVRVNGIRNVNGVVEGGGEATVTWKPPEAPPRRGGGGPLEPEPPSPAPGPEER